ncbi:MAG TPA: NAD(P)/FAD-dependent oxidoreductase [Thermoanaerobaculia bacterium]
MNREIEILGAGPAGLAAALTVARAGRAVTLYERAPDVGRRFHGDLQGLENWTTAGDVLEELAAMGIQPTFDFTAIRQGVFFDSDGRERMFRSHRPAFYLVRRGTGAGTLDQSLKEQALAAGVTIRFGQAPPQLPPPCIRTPGPGRCDALDVGYVFETDMADGVFAVLSERLAPKGYAYLLVCRGWGTVASCLFEDYGNAREYRERTRRFFERKAGLKMQNARAFGGTGNVRARPLVRAGDTLYAGEAAGLQDALWGFGMRYALVSGHMAGQALLAERPAQYDRSFRQRFTGFLRTSVVNRYFYERMGDRGYARLLHAIGRTHDAREWLRRFYAPRLWKTLWFPVARVAVEAARRRAETAPRVAPEPVLR